MYRKSLLPLFAALTLVIGLAAASSAAASQATTCKASVKSGKRSCHQHPGNYPITTPRRPKTGGGVGTPVVPVMPVPQGDRDGACTTDTGQFEDLLGEQINSGFWTDPDGVTHPVVPAPFVEGVGLTCSTAGYTFSGAYVTGNGSVDTAAPQFNVHPLYS